MGAVPIFLLLASCASRPIVIAHRGASGSLPEHTLEAYRLAIEEGADFIEVDLVMSRDGRLIARHESDLRLSTDIGTHPDLVQRPFSEDLTLVEVQRLRAVERYPPLRPGSARFSGRFAIPTLEEVIDLVKGLERERGRRIGLYIETKGSSRFRARGLRLEETLVAILHRSGYRGRRAPVFLQSFEPSSLRMLAALTDLLRIQLISGDGKPPDAGTGGSDVTYARMAAPAGLEEVARYAHGIGPEKSLVIPRDATGRLEEATHLVHDAHAAGLLVHPYTFRAENHFLPAELRSDSKESPDPARHGDLAGEIRAFLAAGIDGFFTDHTAIGAAAVSAR